MQSVSTKELEQVSGGFTLNVSTILALQANASVGSAFVLQANSITVVQK